MYAGCSCQKLKKNPCTLKKKSNKKTLFICIQNIFPNHTLTCLVDLALANSLTLTSCSFHACYFITYFHVQRMIQSWSLKKFPYPSPDKPIAQLLRVLIFLRHLSLVWRVLHVLVRRILWADSIPCNYIYCNYLDMILGGIQLSPVSQLAKGKTDFAQACMLCF